MTTTPAGWYPDPEREGATRWWDGAQWAPSQDTDAASEDRFKPRDDAAATSTDEPAADAAWSPTPYEGPGTAWEQQDQPAAQWSQQQDGAGWDRSPGQTPDAAAPAWGQQDASASAQPSWSQPSSTPAWGQQDAQTGYAAPQDSGQTGTQQWNQYGAAPKKSRTGLIIGIAAGALVLVLLLVVGGGFLVTSLLGTATQQTQTQGGGGGGGGGTQTPGSSFEVTVPADGQTYTDIEITTAGTYVISVESLNGEDPRIELTGNGQSWSDDDGGDGLDSMLTESLDPGTYTLMVEEYGGAPLVAQVTVS